MTWLNESDVRAQLQSVGLIIDGGLELATPSGHSRRVRVSGMDKEKRGWYRLSEWVTDEGVMLIGTYGVFQGDDAGTRKVDISKRCGECSCEMPLKAKECPSCKSKQFKSRELTPEQKAAMKAKLAEDKRRAAAERKAEIDKAARWAGAVWRASKECTVGDHDYFARKYLDTPGGARIYPGNEGVKLEGATHEDYKYLGQFAGALVVPMCDADGKVYGLQFILSREHHKDRIRRTERDKEFWPAGMSAEGKYFMAGGTPTGVCLIAEGYATGMSMHMATGLPVAIAFTAGNLQPVAAKLRARYKRANLLIGADDDWLQKCKACGTYTPVAESNCSHCGQPHGKINAGVTRANEASIAVPGCAFVKPVFSDPRPADKKGPTDFNDLHALEGINTVRQQIEAGLDAAGFALLAPSSARGVQPEGGGELAGMVSRLTIDEAAERYWGTYGLGGDVLFDAAERRLVHKKDVVNLLPRHGWDQLKEHPAWRVARDTEIGFDPTESDRQIKCNLFGGWPTVSRAGKCDRLLDLLQYMCGNEANDREVYEWVLKWLAYPIQHPGAKMHTALVFHGWQGTGKSRFFEAYAKIFGPYGRVLGQEALEDKFNADWAEKKLFILADEVLARQDMYHIKNRLKGFITGDTIRVNPKNIAAHNEKNQMNIVFLSNERMPLVLEIDDRRHLVIWVPPKPGDDYFAKVNEEIDEGGIAALHHHLANLNLGDFKPWTKPPMTSAKQDLIDLGISSEERFVREWANHELETHDGDILPFCPCLGSSLYKQYERWCELNGERKRSLKNLIGHLNKLPGWSAGKSTPTYASFTDKSVKNRKMVVPSGIQVDAAIKANAPPGSPMLKLLSDDHPTKQGWLTACFFAFENATQGQP